MTTNTHFPANVPQIRAETVTRRSSVCLDAKLLHFETMFYLPGALKTLNSLRTFEMIQGRITYMADRVN